MNLFPRNPFHWAATQARRRGLRRTLTVAWSYAEDCLFDWRHGTDTLRRIEVSGMDFTSDNKAHAKTYGATKARPFHALVRRLDLPRDSTFVDIGSGKGRVLMLAAQAGFRRIVGIDFCPQLCEVARHNLELFRARRGPAAEIEIVNVDATTYAFRPDEQVFFMFDPFRPVIVNQVIRNLGASIRLHPRKCWLLYLAPQYHASVMEAGVFHRVEDFTLCGADYKVYTL